MGAPADDEANEEPDRPNVADPLGSDVVDEPGPHSEQSAGNDRGDGDGELPARDVRGFVHVATLGGGAFRGPFDGRNGSES